MVTVRVARVGGITRMDNATFSACSQAEIPSSDDPKTQKSLPHPTFKNHPPSQAGRRFYQNSEANAPLFTEDRARIPIIAIS